MGPQEGALGQSGYNPTLLAQELDLIKSYGANIIRISFAYELWINNPSYNGVPYHTLLHNYFSAANQRGIYVMLQPLAIMYGLSSTGDPLPWVNSYPGYIDNPMEWVNFWVNYANSMKDLPNVIIDPHNEPMAADGYGANDWFSALQSMITAVRATGFSGLILEQWNSNTWCNLDCLSSRQDSSWATAYPISDPLNNIVISDHEYRSTGSLGFWSTSNGAPPNVPATSTTDIELALTDDLIYYVHYTLDKPILIAECGAFVGDPNEQTAFVNQLTIYNSLGLSYLAWNWNTYGAFHLFTDLSNPLNTLTDEGVNFQTAINNNKSLYTVAVQAGTGGTTSPISQTNGDTSQDNQTGTIIPQFSNKVDYNYIVLFVDSYIKANTVGGSVDPHYDLNGDGRIDYKDVIMLVDFTVLANCILANGANSALPP